MVGKCGGDCYRQRRDQCAVRQMVDYQAEASERNSEANHGRLDCKSSMAEALTGPTRQLGATELVEPALPNRETAVALGARVVQERQFEQRLDAVDARAFC